jgi:tripartite-type tricarboxylate transporter receptor subunit TctC
MLKSLAGALLAGTAASAIAAAPAPYPDKPIRLVVPFGPGGATDIVARSLAQKMTDAWGQSVVIDNRGGAGGIIGSDTVAKAPADGYTLLLATTGNATQVALQSKLPFDLQKDFAPITQLIDAPFLITVYPKLPAASLKELIALAKAKPGSLNYGTVGGFNLLMMELVKSMSGSEITPVPYKGVGPALIDLMAGRVNMMLFSVGVALPYLKDNRLRALAVTTAKRVPLMPDLPAISEVLPGYDMTAWYGMLAPAGTPKAVVDKLNAEMVRALKLRDIQESYHLQGFIPVGSTPGQFAQKIDQSILKFRGIVRDAKIPLEG